MGKVILWMQLSLDGFTAGPNGELDWPTVDPEVHQYFNDELRSADTFLYGRKVYEGMAAFWPTADADPAGSPRLADYSQIWKPMPKIVFSRTLEDAEWNTRVVGNDIAGEVARPASTFIQQDLIDEYRLFLHPVVLGDGASLFSGLDDRINLRLVESQTFDSAVVHVRYERR